MYSPVLQYYTKFCQNLSTDQNIKCRVWAKPLVQNLLTGLSIWTPLFDSCASPREICGWQRDRFFSWHFNSALPLSFHQCPTLIHLSLMLHYQNCQHHQALASPHSVTSDTELLHVVGNKYDKKESEIEARKMYTNYNLHVIIWTINK